MYWKIAFFILAPVVINYGVGYLVQALRAHAKAPKGLITRGVPMR